MLGDHTQEHQLSTDEPLVELALLSGFYEVRGRGEPYLYSDPMIGIRREVLLALKGETFRRLDENGRKRTWKTPSRLYLPLIVDTEYQGLPNPDLEPDYHRFILGKLHTIARGSLPLTVQVNTIRPSRAGVKTYLHPLYARAFPRHRSVVPVAADPIGAYINELVPGSRIETFRDSDDESLKVLRRTRVLRIDLYAHFAVADFLKVWPSGPVRDTLLRLAYQEDFQIDQGRRLKFEIERKFRNGRIDRTRWLPMPAKVVLNGVPFALELGIVDTVSMAGNAGLSLQGFHDCAGIALPAKDVYKKHQKAAMLCQFVAACDPEGLAAGVYDGLKNAAPHLLNEALVLREGYGEGNPFLEYAEGDVLTLYQAVSAFARQFRELYEALGVGHHYRPPAFTVGSTVHSLLQARVFALFESKGDRLGRKEQKFLLEYGCEPGRARSLSEQSTWAAANARVFGGRAISTSPTLISRSGAVICDMDLAGAYAAAMLDQILPIGRPIIDLKFNTSSKRNRYPRLGDYLAKHGDQFVPGCWQLMISVETDDGKTLPLPSDQDYFISWSAPAVFYGGTADDKPGVWLERPDTAKVYTRQITNSIFTTDSLDILNHAFSKDLRAFILKNARVKAALFYPKAERCDTPSELMKRLRTATKDGRENTSDVKVRKGKSKITIVENECHAWLGVTLGDLLLKDLTNERNRWKRFTNGYDTLKKSGVESVDDLHKLNADNLAEIQYLVSEHEGGHPGGLEAMIERSKAGGKHPKDELAKLSSNTTYGDIVSRFFALSNPCIGNTITSKVRSMIWLFEKSCRAWNSITDGGLFDLNEVNVWRLSRGGLNEQNTVFALDQKRRDLHHEGVSLKPLGHLNADPVLRWAWEGNQIRVDRKSGSYTLEVKAAQELVNQLTLEHVRASFDNQIAVLDPKTSRFKFEAKGIVKSAAVHGTANYFLQGGGHGGYKGGRDWCVKFRSYRDDVHETVLKPFFEQLIENPEAIERARYWKPFTVSTVLKVKRWRDAYLNYYSKTILEPGDTELTIKMLREFTPSAFRFQTFEQERKFTNAHQNYRDLGNPSGKSSTSARGQSFESFFTKDNVMNYLRMMREVEAAVRDGRETVHPELVVNEHPMRQIALEMKRERLREVVLNTERYDEYDPDPNSIEFYSEELTAEHYL